MGSNPNEITAWVSAGAAVVQAIGAIAAIGVAIKLARDSERCAIVAEREAVEREVAAERAAAARADAADKAAEARIERSLSDQRRGMVQSIVVLANELLDDVEEQLFLAKDQFEKPDFVGHVTGGYAPKRTPEIEKLIPEWKLRANDTKLVRAISALEKAIQPWTSPSGGIPGPSYVALFRSKRHGIAAAISDIENSG